MPYLWWYFSTRWEFEIKNLNSLIQFILFLIFLIVLTISLLYYYSIWYSSQVNEFNRSLEYKQYKYISKVTFLTCNIFQNFIIGIHVPYCTCSREWQNILKIWELHFFATWKVFQSRVYHKRKNIHIDKHLHSGNVMIVSKLLRGQNLSL